MENNFTKNICYLRQKYGLTQTEFADIIGKKKSVVGQYEKSLNEPGISVLQKISHHFGIDYKDLLEKDLELEAILGDTIPTLPRNSQEYKDAMTYSKKQDEFAKDTGEFIKAAEDTLKNGSVAEKDKCCTELTDRLKDLNNRCHDQAHQLIECYQKYEALIKTLKINKLF